jgi:HEAT repeat protein
VARSDPELTPHGADGDSITTAVLSALNHENRQVRSRVIEEASRAADPDLLVRAVADHHDAIRRNAAMDALVRAGRRSVPALVRALDHDDGEVVMFAAGLLGRTRDREAIPHLLRLLDYEDVNIVQAAVESLGYLRACAAVDHLIGLLERDPWVRLGAIHALGEIGHERAVDALASALADADAWDIAVTALGKVRSPRAVEHLAEALWTSALTPELPVVVRALADALRRLPAPEPLRQVPSFARLAGGEARVLHERLAGLLDEIGEHDGPDRLELADAAVLLVRMLRLTPLYPAVVRCGRSAALRPAVQFCALGVGSEIAAALGLVLDDADEELRAFACRCAGALRLADLGGPLVERLRDGEPAVRAAAVQALARIGAPTAVGALAERLLDGSPIVRSAAQAGLGMLDPAAASAALLSLPHRDPSIVMAMLRLSRANPSAGQLPFLLDCLQHGEVEIRRLAVEALGEHPELAVVELLEPALDDVADEVRRAAIEVFGRRRTVRVRDLLLARLPRETVWLSLLLETLVGIEGANIAAILLDRYHQASGPARLPLLEALAELREPAAEPLAAEMLAHADAEIRRAAVRTMARFGSELAARYILAAATDPAWQVRATVAEVLGDLDHPGAAGELERLSLDEHAFVATTARHCLEVEHGA